MSAYEEKNIDKLNSFMAFEERQQSLFDPDYIRELFLKRGLNISALNNYLECPKKYLYKNLIRIPDVYSTTLIFGSIVHRALELFFKDSGKEGKILPKNVLLEKFEITLKKNMLSLAEEEKIRQRGHNLLSDYYDEYKDDWVCKTKTEVGPERAFELEDKQTITLNGKIDKIEYLDDVYEGEVNLIDYKTGKPFSEKSKEDRANYERQIIFYHLLLESSDKKIKINKSTLDFLEKNKKGQYEQYTLEVTEEHLGKLRQEINMMAQDVLSMEFLKKGCGKPDCPWCNM